MRTRRYLAPLEAEFGYYHCVSRVGNRARILRREHHEEFVRVLKSQAAFAGVRLLTYCLLDNHFHVLLEVPCRPETGLGEEELLRRLGAIYSKTQVEEIRRHRGELGAEERAALDQGICRRMWDLSQYMKDTKQRFTQWFNRKEGRSGPLWEGRFKSVLVGVDGRALATMAAYIDLNPVRAGIVEDPKDYRWSGFHEAMAGSREAREAYRRVMQLAEGKEREDFFEAYRRWLYASGEQPGSHAPGEPPVVRKGIAPERVKAVMARKGKLKLGESLHCRMRHLSDGAVLGTREFVDGMIRHQKERFGVTRRTGARPLRYLEESVLCALRDLKRTPVELPTGSSSSASG